MQNKDNSKSEKNANAASIQLVFIRAEDSDIKKQHTQLLKFYQHYENWKDYKFDESKFEFEYPQTSSQVPWSAKFKYLLSVNIFPKEKDSSLPKNLISVYHHQYSSEYLQLEYILCYGDYGCSKAKIVYSNNTNCLVINSMNNMAGNYRIGSFLIQLAVENSLRKGLKGRIELTSIKCSGQFYFKLGFAPKDKLILEKLSSGKNVDGEEMYLTENAIDLWKAIIAKSPILLSSAEISKYCLNEEHCANNYNSWCSMFKRAIPLALVAATTAYVYTNLNSL